MKQGLFVPYLQWPSRASFSLYAANRCVFLAERSLACRLCEGEPETGVAADGALAEPKQRVGLRSCRYR